MWWKSLMVTAATAFALLGTTAWAEDNHRALPKDSTPLAQDRPADDNGTPTVTQSDGDDVTLVRKRGGYRRGSRYLPGLRYGRPWYGYRYGYQPYYYYRHGYQPYYYYPGYRAYYYQPGWYPYRYGYRYNYYYPY
jgi:hypothetical protein